MSARYAGMTEAECRELCARAFADGSFKLVKLVPRENQTVMPRTPEKFAVVLRAWLAKIGDEEFQQRDFRPFYQASGCGLAEKSISFYLLCAVQDKIISKRVISPRLFSYQKFTEVAP